MATAVRDRIITEESSVFDYGCGKGDDITLLRKQQIDAAGWDPVFKPRVRRRPSDVVNLGYVVNVIEDPEERASTLRSAWELAQRALVVAARTVWEAQGLRAEEHGDGLVTRRGTFQKFYSQDELRDWIDETLGARSVAAAPGIFYVFREDSARESFLASRYRRRTAAPKVRVSELLFDEHREALEPLMAFIAERGRLPRDDEFSGSNAVQEAFGTLRKAFLVVRRVTGDKRWAEIAEERTQDLLVYLALARFPRRPRLSDLPRDIMYDIREFQGTYKRACQTADDLLFSVGRQETIDAATRSAAVGKLTSEALYIHVSAVDMLPPALRVFEGCAKALTGVIDGANVIKLHRDGARVSYLSYPDFDHDPHPALAWGMIVRPGKLRAELRDYRDSGNPPILHRKETFVASGYPQREKFERLSIQEDRLGLLSDPYIGHRDGWISALRSRGLRLRGHRVVRISKD